MALAGDGCSVVSSDGSGVVFGTDFGVVSNHTLTGE